MRREPPTFRNRQEWKGKGGCEGVVFLAIVSVLAGLAVWLIPKVVAWVF